MSWPRKTKIIFTEFTAVVHFFLAFECKEQNQAFIYSNIVSRGDEVSNVERIRKIKSPMYYIKHTLHCFKIDVICKVDSKLLNKTENLVIFVYE